jgi:hypothetical protein
LKTKDLFKPIWIALAFRIPNGDDFVAYVDSEKTLCIFEAFYPEKTQVVGRLKDNPLRMQYLREARWVVAFGKNGCFAKSCFPEMTLPPEAR